MDFNYALWTILQLIVSPKTAYRQTSYHKQTKNQWARDDPAFVVISSGIVAAVTLIYCLIFKPSFWLALTTMIHVVFVDYLCIGCMAASTTWLIASRVLSKRSAHSHALIDQSIEWAYAFDVHCNSFVPLFLLLGLGQLVLSPILLLNSWLAAILSSSLYAVAFTLYFYVTFLGYSALPTLDNTELYLYPVGVVVLSLVMSMIVGFNPTKLVMRLFYGYH